VTCKPPRAALRASAAPMMPNPRMATFVLMQIRCGYRRLDAPGVKTRRFSIEEETAGLRNETQRPSQKCHPDRSVAKWRDLLFRRPFLEMFFSTEAYLEETSAVATRKPYSTW
jgi:hypothetical protein